MKGPTIQHYLMIYPRLSDISIFHGRPSSYLSLSLCLVHFAVVPQSYSVNVMDESILRGNSAILKCHIPSFVADFIVVDSWVEDEEREIYPQADVTASGKPLALSFQSFLRLASSATLTQNKSRPIQFQISMPACWMIIQCLGPRLSLTGPQLLRC